MAKIIITIEDVAEGIFVGAEPTWTPEEEQQGSPACTLADSLLKSAHVIMASSDPDATVIDPITGEESKLQQFVDEHGSKAKTYGELKYT